MGRRKAKRNSMKNQNMRRNFFSKIRYFVFFVFPAIVLVVGIYFMSLNFKAYFHIKEIVFHGNTHLSDEELTDLAGLRGKENLITISSRTLFEKMSSSPWIRSASIRKVLPDKLHIYIKESEPFALLDLNGSLFIVDEKGKMLQELKDSPIPFLPVISGTSFCNQDIFLEGPQEMSVNLDGIVVKVGKGDYKEKLLRLMDIEEEIQKRKIHVDYIDLRFANRVVVKPMSEVIN
jgi:cell division protein FtsQ